MLRSDWDKDEEYIFDDSYDSDNNSDDDDADNNLDRFKEIDDAEIEELHKHNDNNNDANAQNNEENVDQAGVPAENINQAWVPDKNINQAGVPQEQLPAIPEQPEQVEGPHIVEDKSVATANDDNRPNRDRRTVDHLMYETLGKTHQQSETQDTHPDAFLEQCHNIMSTEEHESNAYSPDKANMIARVMVQIYEQAQLHDAEFIQKHSAEYKEYAQQYAQQYSFDEG